MENFKGYKMQQIEIYLEKFEQAMLKVSNLLF
jgi:hypothetical protein